MEWSMPYFDSKVTGVELVIAPDGTHSYNFVILQKSGSKIEIVTSLEGIKELTGVLDVKNKSNPVLLSITGKGVIHKKVGIKEDESFESFLNKVLPNSNIVEFYLQSFRLDSETAYVSVVRNSMINSIINSLVAQEFRLIACTLGPFAVQSILPLLQMENESSSELKFSNHELLLRGGSIVNYTQVSNEEAAKNIASESINISSNLLIAYSTAFAYFNPSISISSNNAFFLAKFIDFKHEVKFKKTGVSILGTVFLLLFLNFLAFSYLSDQVKSKSTTALLSSSELDMIDSMSNQMKERTLFLSKSGLSEPSRTSFYGDEIAKELPEALTLSRVDIQPKKKNTDDEKNIEFENRKILVSGRSKYSLDVNEWIKTMRKKDWINTISLLTYRQKEEGTQGEFLIEIKIR